MHFASHSFINAAHPDLSGIVLSLVDRNGQEQDGFLRLYEIYNLKLSADLVVLGGCRTGLGKEIKGEGLISLTRGFMYAGAPPRHRQRLGSPGPAIGDADGQILPILARPEAIVGGGGVARRADRDVARQTIRRALLLGRLHSARRMEVKL